MDTLLEKVHFLLPSHKRVQFSRFPQAFFLKQLEMCHTIDEDHIRLLDMSPSYHNRPAQEVQKYECFKDTSFLSDLNIDNLLSVVAYLDRSNHIVRPSLTPAIGHWEHLNITPEQQALKCYQTLSRESTAVPTHFGGIFHVNGNHWISVWCSVHEGLFQIYDPLQKSFELVGQDAPQGAVGKHNLLFLDAYLQLLREKLGATNNVPLRKLLWGTLYAQHNSYDCGIYAALSLFAVVEGCAPTSLPSDINLLRNLYYLWPRVMTTNPPAFTKIAEDDNTGAPTVKPFKNKQESEADASQIRATQANIDQLETLQTEVISGQMSAKERFKKAQQLNELRQSLEQKGNSLSNLNKALNQKLAAVHHRKDYLVIVRPDSNMALPLYRMIRRKLFTTVTSKTRGLEMFTDAPTEEEVIYTHHREILNVETFREVLASPRPAHEMLAIAQATRSNRQKDFDEDEEAAEAEAIERAGHRRDEDNDISEEEGEGESLDSNDDREPADDKSIGSLADFIAPESSPEHSPE